MEAAAGAHPAGPFQEARATARGYETPMDLDLGGKLALITGGSRGIGRAVGEALAAEGCRLVLVSRRAADLDVARTQIEGRYNVSVRTDAADLGDSTNVPRLARLFPDVDILVNNAGAIPGGYTSGVVVTLDAGISSRSGAG